MAYTTRTHGDFKPQMNFDADSYTVGSVNAVTSAATVQPQGPKLDFFTMTLAGSSTTGDQIKAAIDTIQQLATVYLYEFTTDTNDTLAFAVYPTGAWTTTTLNTALDAATGEDVTVTATATFTG